MRRFGLVSVVLILLPVLLYAQQTTTSQPAAPNPEAVVAEMDGYRLTQAELDVIIGLLPASSKPSMNTEMKQQVLKAWMQVAVFALEAASQKIDQDPNFLHQFELYKKQLLAERYRNGLVKDVSISDDDVKAYYEANQESFRLPSQAKVSRILLPTREKADEVKKALDGGGSFEALAKEHSIDGLTKPKGGDMGWVRAGTQEPAFNDVIFSLEPGKISEPVATSIGWVIVRVTEVRPGTQRTLDQIRGPLTQTLLAQKKQKVIDQAADQLFQKYSVKIHGVAQ